MTLTWQCVHTNHTDTAMCTHVWHWLRNVYTQVTLTRRCIHISATYTVMCTHKWHSYDDVYTQLTLIWRCVHLPVSRLVMYWNPHQGVDLVSRLTQHKMVTIILTGIHYICTYLAHHTSSTAQEKESITFALGHLTHHAWGTRGGFWDGWVSCLSGLDQVINTPQFYHFNIIIFTVIIMYFTVGLRKIPHTWRQLWYTSCWSWGSGLDV